MKFLSVSTDSQVVSSVGGVMAEEEGWHSYSDFSLTSFQYESFHNSMICSLVYQRPLCSWVELSVSFPFS